jgi:hypothetical protein
MRTASLIFFVLCLFGCETSAVSPSFPVTTQVSQLSISGGKVVTEQSKISELFAHLGQIKGEWSHTWHTYPSPQAQILFVGSSGQALCRLDIGPNWVGSNCGVELKSNWPPLVTISREQALFFRDFVAGAWEVK